MPARMNLSGRVAVVTGAASGIGRTISISLARRRCGLTLADIDEAGLLETEHLVAGGRQRISQHWLDVADRTGVALYPTPRSPRTASSIFLSQRRRRARRELR